MPPKQTLTPEIKTLVRETIKEILSDETFIEVIIQKVTEKINKLEEITQKQEKIIGQLEIKIDNLQQNGKQNNLCIHGIEEEENEKLYDKVITLINGKVNVPVRHEDIINCYRVGFNKEKIRPVIIKFDRLYIRNKILLNRSKLKGTKVVICEDLTKNRLTLFRMAQEALDKKRVLTRDGNIVVKMENNRRKTIYNKEDLEQFKNN